jgi:hypothetical protein
MTHQSWQHKMRSYLELMFYQLQNWNGGPPNIYDISGSAHFINKCDNGIVIHRNRDPNAGPLDTVQVIFALIFTLSSMRFVYPFLLRRNLIVCQPLCSTTWLLSQVCVRKVRNKVVGQIGDAFLTYDRCVFLCSILKFLSLALILYLPTFLYPVLVNHQI